MARGQTSNDSLLEIEQVKKSDKFSSKSLQREKGIRKILTSDLFLTVSSTIIFLALLITLGYHGWRPTKAYLDANSHLIKEGLPAVQYQANLNSVYLHPNATNKARNTL